jgi:hypothetical protein
MDARPRRNVSRKYVEREGGGRNWKTIGDSGSLWDWPQMNAAIVKCASNVRCVRRESDSANGRGTARWSGGGPHVETGELAKKRSPQT